jgi:hypothetical protein
MMDSIYTYDGKNKEYIYKYTIWNEVKFLLLILRHCQHLTLYSIE